MATVLKHDYSEAEYVQQERKSPNKSKYYRGEIFARSGATREHNLVVANLVRQLGRQLQTYITKFHPYKTR